MGEDTGAGGVGGRDAGGRLAALSRRQRSKEGVGRRTVGTGGQDITHSAHLLCTPITAGSLGAWARDMRSGAPLGTTERLLSARYCIHLKHCFMSSSQQLHFICEGIEVQDIK